MKLSALLHPSITEITPTKTEIHYQPVVTVRLAGESEERLGRLLFVNTSKLSARSRCVTVAKIYHKRNADPLGEIWRLLPRQVVRVVTDSELTEWQRRGWRIV